MNSQYVKHVGYQNTNDGISAYFSPSTARFISSKVTSLLKPYYPNGIIIPCERIVELMNDVYEAYRPSTGDIFTRYSIPSDENPNYIDEMINQVITIATDNVKNNLLTEQRNSQLTVWSSLYGDFNQQGLRQHAPIKTREKRPQPMQFHMNY